MRRFILAVGLAILVPELPSAQGPAILPSHLARMYPATSRAMWGHVLNIVADHHFGTKKMGGEEQFVILRDVPVDPKHFDFKADSIDRQWDHAYAEVHIFVPPTAEPARVYIASRVTGFPQVVNGLKLGPQRTYNAIPVGAWFHARLAEKIGSDGFDIPSAMTDRLRLAQSLPPGQPTTCLARLLSGQLRSADATKPVELHHERMELPQGRRPSALTVDTRVFEDGFVWPIGIVGEPSGEFGMAAITSLMMSAHKPAMVDGCGVPVDATFTVKIGE